jgi:hypothetical protein
MVSGTELLTFPPFLVATTLMCILRLPLSGEQQDAPACIIERLHAIVYFIWKAIENMQ